MGYIIAEMIYSLLRKQFDMFFFQTGSTLIKISKYQGKPNKTLNGKNTLRQKFRVPFLVCISFKYILVFSILYSNN